MSDRVQTITQHRLAIAKEMYLEGVTFVNNESRTSLISAIINFDYAVETILKGVILQNNIPLDRFKTFPALVKDILGLKKNVSNAIIEQINALHDLRNNVEHQACHSLLG